jgi:5-methylcytosine-specific restriction endonuclease McrA
LKRIRYCQLPAPMNVTGRSSSITNAFITAIIPVIEPTEAEELEALRILGMSPDDIRCAYCGDRSTEWDHLRPVITKQEPTGYITEIANLVPSCGKCNQSKGKSHWRTWMEGRAKLSPATRGVPDIDERIARLQAYEAWRQPRRIDFAAIVGPEMWERHRQNWRDVLDLLKKSQELASEIRVIVERGGQTGMQAAGTASAARDDAVLSDKRPRHYG